MRANDPLTPEEHAALVAAKLTGERLRYVVIRSRGNNYWWDVYDSRQQGTIVRTNDEVIARQEADGYNARWLSNR